MKPLSNLPPGVTDADIERAAGAFDNEPWVECWQCGGEGSVESCFEDTCVCIDPPCQWKRCDVCRGEGGWPLYEDEKTA